jgi:hypothetical protein
MAYETPSPLGIPWGYVVLLLLPVLVVVTVIYGVRTRRELLGRAGLVVVAAAAAGAWALVHTGPRPPGTWEVTRASASGTHGAKVTAATRPTLPATARSRAS